MASLPQSQPVTPWPLLHRANTKPRQPSAQLRSLSFLPHVFLGALLNKTQQILFFLLILSGERISNSQSKDTEKVKQGKQEDGVPHFHSLPATPLLLVLPAPLGLKARVKAEGKSSCFPTYARTYPKPRQQDLHQNATNSHVNV